MKVADRKPGFLQWADRAGRVVENALIVVILSGMILLGGAQILLRNLLSSGLPWADEALRLMVLWVAMVGAVAASREGRHITIDVLSRILPVPARPWVGVVVHTFTAAVALTLAWYSGIFVADSFAYQDRLVADLPAWLLQAVMPAAFGLIGYRYCIWLVRSVRKIFQGSGEA